MLDLHNRSVMLELLRAMLERRARSRAVTACCQYRGEGSIPTLPLSDLPWHCKIPQVKPCSRCRSPSTEWHLAEQKCTGLLRLHRHYPAKHFMLNVALATRQNRELLYITHRHSAANLRPFLLCHCYKSNPFVRRDF